MESDQTKSAKPSTRRIAYRLYYIDDERPRSRRTIAAYHIAKAMNMLQKSYAHSFKLIGGSGREVAEWFVVGDDSFMGGTGFDTKAPLAQHISKRFQGKDKMWKHLDCLRTLGNKASHAHLEFTAAMKPKVADSV